MVDGTDATGRSGEWLIEANPTPLMVRSGWQASTLARGDAVSVRMFPDREPAKRHGLLASLTRADGLVLGMREGARAAPSGMSSIAGVWDALPAFGVPFIDQDRNPPRRYTDAALRACEQFSVELYPLPSASRFRRR